MVQGAAHSSSMGPYKEKGSNTYWPSIGNKDQIPGWLRDNDYIVKGHPMPTYSYRRSFWLWRCLHMETMNIWTHLIGSLGYVVAGFTLRQYALASGRVNFTRGDAFAFGSFMTPAAVCFGLSSTFHTLRSHSYNIHHFWGRMGILGICVLALGGGISMTYYAFYCSPITQRVYWGRILYSALAGAVTLFDSGGGGSKIRAFRGSVFFLHGLSAMLPVFHRASQLGWVRPRSEIGAGWYLAEALSLLFGVGLFVCRVPERLSPGSFDIWGHSHQLFHVCAVLGGVFEVVVLLSGYNYRQTQQICWAVLGNLLVEDYNIPV